MRTHRLLVELFLVLVLAVPACSVLDPRLAPVAPPPNQEEGLLLMEVPERLLGAIRSETVLAHRERRLALLGALDPARAERIEAHQIITGMTTEDVVCAFLAHPTRVRNQGPPGGHTLLWEATSFWIPSRYWVRFDETGHAVAAGRY